MNPSLVAKKGLWLWPTKQSWKVVKFFFSSLTTVSKLESPLSSVSCTYSVSGPFTEPWTKSASPSTWKVFISLSRSSRPASSSRSRVQSRARVASGLKTIRRGLMAAYSWFPISSSSKRSCASCRHSTGLGP